MRAMITGAAGGLGRVMAAECARRGYDLFLTDLTAEPLECLKEGLRRRFSVQIDVFPCDLTDPSQVTKMFQSVDQAGFRFDLLLNIAGLDYEGGFMDRTGEEVIRIVQLNDVAALRITHDVISRRVPGEKLTLVFVSSLASMFPMPLKATYAASKRFLFDFAQALREECRGRNIQVMALCPGGLTTNPTVMEAIAAQGFWGDATTKPLETVARRTLDRALRGRACYFPGLLNRCLMRLGRLVPRQLVALVIHWRWSGAQKKWMEG